MTLKKEAAYHEAGHAIVARLSEFHEIVGGIELADYGAGESFIALSKRKLRAVGKSESPKSAKDTDVARDLALIPTAGYVAEKIAADKDKNLLPCIASAKPDHDLLKDTLSNAGLSKKFDRFEKEVEKILEEKWVVVDSLASFLFECGSVDYDDLDKKLRQLMP